MGIAKIEIIPYLCGFRGVRGWLGALSTLGECVQ